MPSTTRGSILISTANDIGSTLVDKLGGDGYTPEEWDSAANLCGIASADIATALSNIQESTPGGADRGSISIAKANSIGRILNKKFDTSRGFKPSEWASAIDKLTPLEIKTASGAIASFSDGADGVPVKSCVVSFTPSGGGGTPQNPISVQGVSGLSVTQLGKNLFDKSTITPNTWIIVDSTNTEPTVSYRTSDFIRVEAGKRYWITAKSSNRSAYYDLNKNGIAYFSFPGGTSFQALYDGYIRITINNNIDLDTFIVAEGSTEPTYEAFDGVVVTDTFGQTIYGGSRDLTTDKASVTWLSVSISDLTFVKEGTCQHTFRCGTLDRKFGSGNYNLISASFVTYTQGHSSGSNISTLEVGNDFTIFCNSGSKTFYISTDSSYDSKTASQFTTDFGSVLLVFELATPTEITGLTPHEIDTLYGDNNFYADTGTMSVEYRADIDLALNA